MTVEIVCHASHERLVTAALLLHGDMKIPEIAWRTGLMRAQVESAVKRLHKKGVLDFINRELDAKTAKAEGA